MVPNFLILGTAKSGTTTLCRVLEHHPDIAMSRPKEPLFFESEFDRGLEYYWDTYYSHWQNETAIGEARVAHFHLSYAAENIAKALPDAKLIVILRNPVDRAFSHWWMNKSHGSEPDSFHVALQKNVEAIKNGRHFEGAEGQANWLDYTSKDRRTASVYLEVGQYAENIDLYLKHFSRSQLLVLFFDDLTCKPEKVFQQICDFLEIPYCESLPIQRQDNQASNSASVGLRAISKKSRVSQFVPLSVKRTLHKLTSQLGGRPSMDDKSRQFLIDYYRTHNERLEKILDVKLTKWNT